MLRCFGTSLQLRLTDSDMEMFLSDEVNRKYSSSDDEQVIDLYKEIKRVRHDFQYIFIALQPWILCTYPLNRLKF